MFLWCGCHCKTEPGSVSESGSSLGGSVLSYSSGDSAQPEEPNTPVGPCFWCLYGAAPVHYELTWNYTGQAAAAPLQRPCCADYTAIKKMRLTRFGQPSGQQCSWRSDVLARRRFQNQCLGPFISGPDGRRAYVVIGNYRDVYAGGATIRYEEASFGTSAAYILVDNLGQPIPKTEKADCLRTLSFRAEWAIFNGPQRWESYLVVGGLPTGSPCNQALWGGIDSGLPEFLTITPVPA